MNKLNLLLKAYKIIHDEEVKQKQFDELEATPLNYGIVRDLINSAQYGVDITVKLVDGNIISIRRDEKKQTIVDTGAF